MRDSRQEYARKRERPEEKTGAVFDLPKKLAERARMLEHLRAGGDALGNDDKQILVDTIMRHSVADGIEAANILGEKDGMGYLFAITAMIDAKIFRRHAALFAAISKGVHKEENFIDKDHLTKGVDCLVNSVDSFLKASFQPPDPNRPKDRAPRLAAPKAGELAKEIEHYYLDFIAAHKVQPVPGKDARAKVEPGKVAGKEVEIKKLSGEQVGENFLVKMEKMFKKSVYGSFVRKVVAQKLRGRELKHPEAAEVVDKTKKQKKQGKNEPIEWGRPDMRILKARLTNEEIAQLTYASVIPEADALRILSKLSIDTHERSFQRRLRGNRYAMSDVVFEAQKSGVTVDLKKEILAELAKNGFKTDEMEVVLDDKTGHYMVRYKEEEKKEVEEKKEKTVALEAEFDLNTFEKREIDLTQSLKMVDFTQIANGVAYKNEFSDGTCEVVHADGRVRWPGNHLDSASGIACNNGEAVYAAKIRFGSSSDYALVLINGANNIFHLEDIFSHLYKPVVIDGKVACKGKTKKVKHFGWQGGGWSVRYPDGHLSKEYKNYVRDPVKINGEIVFFVIDDSGTYFCVVHENGIEEKLDVKNVYETYCCGETLAAANSSDPPGKGFRWDILYPPNKDKITPRNYYKRVDSSPVPVDGGIAFGATKDNGRVVVVYPDGSESKREYDEIVAIINVPGQGVAFAAKRGADYYLVYPNGTECYFNDQIKNMAAVNGIIYVASYSSHDSKWYVVGDNALNTHLTPGFDTIDILQEQNGYFMIAGKIGDKFVSYSKKVEEPKKAEAPEMEFANFKKALEVDLSRYPNIVQFAPYKDGVVFCSQEADKLTIVFPNGNTTKMAGARSIVDELVVKDNMVCFNVVTQLAQSKEWTLILAKEDGRVDSIPHGVYRGRKLVNIGNEIYGAELKNSSTWSMRSNGILETATYLGMGDAIKIGDKVVYWAQQDQTTYVIKDAKAGTVLKEITVTSPFTRIGNIPGGIGYFDQASGNYRVLYPVEATISDIADNTAPLVFGDRFAYATSTGNGWFKLRYPDGHEGAAEFKEIEKITKVGNGVAFVGTLDNDNQVVVFPDESESPTAKEVGEIVDVNGETFFTIKSAERSWNVASQKQRFLQEFFEEIKVFSAQNGFLVVSGIVGGKLVTYSHPIDSAASQAPQPGHAVAPKKEIVLGGAEQRKLELLNILAGLGKPNRKTEQEIAEYFNKYLAEEERKTWKERVKGFLSGSPTFATIVSHLIGEKPELFFNTVVATKDSLEPAEVERLVYKLFPEIPRNKRAAAESERAGQPERPGLPPPPPAPQFYLRYRAQEQLEDADPLQTGAEVIELREPVNEFIARTILAKYDQRTNTWSEVPFALQPELEEPIKEHTFKLTAVAGLREVVLPLMLGAQILTERVKGITETGEEEPLICAVNPVGRAIAFVPEKFKLQAIVYSQSRSKLPATLPDISTAAYDGYKKDFERNYGTAATEKITEFSGDVMMFVESMRHKSPKEKVTRIQEFVKSICYCDFDNRVVQGKKTGKSIRNRLAIMEGRLDAIRAEKPDSADKLVGKKYAGVCADFAELTAALLREVGLISGVARGFNAKSQSVTTANAHGVAYVIMPGANGQWRVIAVDGTPGGGLTEAEQQQLDVISQPSLAKQEEQAEAVKRQLTKEASKALEQIKQAIAGGDLTAVIKASTNGNLERLVNTIFYGVRGPHVHVVESVLQALLYAGLKFNDIDFNSADELTNVYNFLKGEIEREKPRAQALPNEPASGRLMKVVRGFVARTEAKDAGTTADRLDKLEKILDLIYNDLNADEASAITAAIVYLRAKQMSGQTKVTV